MKPTILEEDLPGIILDLKPKNICDIDDFYQVLSLLYTKGTFQNGKNIVTFTLLLWEMTIISLEEFIILVKEEIQRTFYTGLIYNDIGLSKMIN